MNRCRGTNRGAVSGVTLLELTAVVAIIAVLSAIAVPPIMSTLGGFKLRATAAGLAGLIQ
jgi:prepilin-type N-terminal cleavage/methylation domain-containing protein